MNSQFKKSIIELYVLKIISLRDSYGYEIVTKVSKHIKINEKTVYPILYRLKKKSYLTSYEKTSNDGPSRKYYQITDLGHERLNQEIKDLIDFTEVIKQLLGESDE